MNLKTGLKAAIVGFISVILSACGAKISPEILKNAPPTVTHVDLNRYLGKWYELAHKPMKYQAQCVSDVTATYTLKSNGDIRVLNECIAAQNKHDQAIGVAKSVSANNSKLKVSFFRPFYAPYWVFWLKEPNDSAIPNQPYTMALVGSPDRRFLWLLAREPKPDLKLRTEALEYAKSIGFDISDLIILPHKD